MKNIPHRKLTLEEQENITQLYIGYRRLMYHIANRILHHAEDSEDAVQQAFLQIAEHACREQDPLPRKPKQLAVVTTIHCAIDIYRKRKRLSLVSLDDLENIAVTCIDDHTLSSCLSSLSPNHRNVILLRYLYGYTPQEIAQILSSTDAAVYKSLQRAKKQLEVLCLEEKIL